MKHSEKVTAVVECAFYDDLLFAVGDRSGGRSCRSRGSVGTASSVARRVINRVVLALQQIREPLVVVPQNLIRADGNAGELPGRANAVDFESGKRCRDGYTALFLSRSTRRQRDASLRERTQRTADGFFDCLE
jgi:hypothetical protein